MPIPTNVYIDGFNLYNGLVRRAKQKGLDEPEYRWLDLTELSRRLLPGSEIQDVWYFTSRVKNLPESPNARQRQETFIRALESTGVRVVYGQFQRNKVWRRLVDDPERGVRILDFKEKGSDVNLAAQLLADAYDCACQKAAVMSADSDLKLPIKIAASKFPRGVTVLNPNSGHARQLEKVATEYVRIKNQTFRASVLPDDISERLKKPESW